MRFAIIILAFVIARATELTAFELQASPEPSGIRQNLGVKLGPVSGQGGLAFGWQLDPQTLIELSYTRDGDYERADSDDSQSESFAVLYRRYIGRSFYLCAGLGVNEYKAVLKKENLQDFEVNVMNRDLNLRVGIGNRWKLDDLWFVGVEWLTFDRSLAQLDRESAVYSLTGFGRKTEAEAFALRSLRDASFQSSAVFNLEFGMNL